MGSFVFSLSSYVSGLPVLCISYWLEVYIYVYWLERSYGRDAWTMILLVVESYICYKKSAEEGTRKIMV